ncbi:MAG: fatty acid-binding protein DegV [Firmicutes bacterium HGW-Firmicutes-9]|jgi:DegV family protein with EDD domain|nr:MAG: fatty acid-binding protein DegV [Firmicutes bacterium HGW-Firmicutes-9]
MSYRIFTEATSDLPAKFAEQLNVTVLPMGFTMEGKEYFYIPGRSDMPIETFFEKMRAGVPVTTAQVNAYTFIEAFEPLLKNGEDILYIGLSSKLSGSVQSGSSAAEELRVKYPERKIFVIDSCCASLGEGLLVYYAARKQDMAVEDLAKWVEDNKLRFIHWFTVEDLVYLKRGGRISGATAAIATILNIKPVMHVDNEGYLVAVEKVQGRKKSLRSLFDRMVKTVDTKETDTVFIGHCDSKADAEYVASLVHEAYPDMMVHIGDIGTSVGAHSGPGTIALFFIGSER